MSFGFAVGDFLSVGEFAWKIYRNCKTAGSEFEELTREVISLHTGLKEFEDEARNPDSLLNRKGTDRKPELERLLRNCMTVLRQLQRLIDKYQSLGTGNKRTWDRVKFGTEGIEDIRRNSSLGRIEKKLDDLIAEIRAGKREPTILSFGEEEEDEDDRVWRSLKTDLVDEGFTKQEVEIHKPAIKKYLQKLILDGDLEESNKGEIQDSKPQTNSLSPHQLYIPPTVESCKDDEEISVCDNRILSKTSSETKSSVSDSKSTCSQKDHHSPQSEIVDGRIESHSSLPRAYQKEFEMRGAEEKFNEGLARRLQVQRPAQDEDEEEDEDELDESHSHPQSSSAASETKGRVDSNSNVPADDYPKQLHVAASQMQPKYDHAGHYNKLSPNLEATSSNETDEWLDANLPNMPSTTSTATRESRINSYSNVNPVQKGNTVTSPASTPTKGGHNCKIDIEETFVNYKPSQSAAIRLPTSQFIILQEDIKMLMLSGSAELDTRVKATECSEFPLGLTLEEFFFGCKKRIRIVDVSRDDLTPGMTYQVKVIEMSIKPGFLVGAKVKFRQDLECALKFMGPNWIWLQEKKKRLEELVSSYVFLIEEKPHPRFVRDDANLYEVLTISLAESLTGIDKKLQTIDGEFVRTQNTLIPYGLEVTFPGRGMPSGGNTDLPRGIDKPRGDFIISFSIQYPDRLDRKWKRELIRKWQNESQGKRGDAVGVVRRQVLPWPHMRSDTRRDKVEDHRAAPQINGQVLGRSRPADLNCETADSAITTPENSAEQASGVVPRIKFKQLPEPSSDISLRGQMASGDNILPFPFADVSISLAHKDSYIVIGRNTPDRESLLTKSPRSIFVNVQSRVVSHNHCEFRYTMNRWFINDVGSSSGTFLNGKRLSEAYVPSIHKVIRSGDVIQLGSTVEESEDFRYSCVKMVVELNDATANPLIEHFERKVDHWLETLEISDD